MRLTKRWLAMLVATLATLATATVGLLAASATAQASTIGNVGDWNVRSSSRSGLTAVPSRWRRRPARTRRVSGGRELSEVG